MGLWYFNGYNMWCNLVVYVSIYQFSFQMKIEHLLYWIELSTNWNELYPNAAKFDSLWQTIDSDKETTKYRLTSIMNMMYIIME